MGVPSTVSPGYYVLKDDGYLKKISDNLNAIKQKITEATDGQGSDTASSMDEVVTKLKNVGVLDSSGNVTSETIEG